MQGDGDVNDENHSPQFARKSLGSTNKEFKELIQHTEVPSRSLSPLRTPPTMKASRGVLQARSQSPPAPLLRPQSPKPLTAKPIATSASIPIVKPLHTKIASSAASTSIPCIISPLSNPTHTTFTLQSITLLSPSPSVKITLSCRGISHSTMAFPASSNTYIPALSSFSFISSPDAKLKLTLDTLENVLEVSIVISTKLTTVPLLHNDSIVGSVKFVLNNLHEVSIALFTLRLRCASVGLL